MKDLDYYLNLKYDIIVQDRSENEEILFIAFTRELNKDAFYGVGESREEAIRSFDEVKEDMFEYLLENGESIPEPQPLDNDLPSGKFIVRTSPILHKRLIELAQENKQSLNAYVNMLLAQESTEDKISTKINSLISEIQTSWFDRKVFNIYYNKSEKSDINESEKEISYKTAM